MTDNAANSGHEAANPTASRQQDTPGALDGVRVLDLSRVLAGPWSTQILADLGAEVIKIERPGAGDDTRSWGPPFVQRQDGSCDAAYYFVANRNKRSVALDISQPEGQAAVRQLAASAHVLVENFKVGGLAAYGLDYDSLKAINPALVYCSVTGFGQSGPYAPRAGYDFLIQGMSGLMSITGQPDGGPGAEPVKVGVATADLSAGLYATIGILAALRHAERTGEGQHLDISLLDCQVSLLANQAQNYLASGQPPRRLGNAHPNVVPYQVFAVADGLLILAVGNDGQFQRFCAEAGVPELARDPRYASNAARVENRDALIATLRPLLAARTGADWIACLEAAGVPCGPINTLDEVFADPHIRARNMAITMPLDEGGGTLPLVANPLRLSRTPPSYRMPPPGLGEHTLEVLAQIERNPAQYLTTDSE
ncbi:CaiB/BaiF CoA transferase family protein [Parahaliea aestuarii]|uniref:CoA transferase n=1 Tax=Parahaliea aestuarii TaxID=1852021 RepID=A0A5C8ZTQ2_9GAMM|nr:CaiB/BaiF CoA-transferase family protein [Parahaliea aestuarii]TXS91179.1 CoA transferase [Parahaliea aestuarii]